MPDMNTATGISAEEYKEKMEELEKLMKETASEYGISDLDPFNLVEAWQQWYEAMLKNPEKMIETSMNYWQDTMKLYQQTAMQMMGIDSEPVIQEGKGDRRFRHQAWEEQPIFNAIKQSYLLGSKCFRDLASNTEGINEQTARKMAFFTEQYIDSLSPTNFALTNPEVIEKAVETKGENLLNGFQNMLADFKKGNGTLKISMTDTDAFELGKNIASSPGKVVFRNRMFELLQYEPGTETVNSIPLLIVPPWINKYYVLDLQPENSFIKWLSDQGHTVFVMSWVNPDETYHDVEFDHYVIDGMIAALDAVNRATGEDKCNAIGYCIGGALLATSLAYLKSKGDDTINSATFLTTMLDYSEPGELGIFTDEEQLESLKEKMSKKGYLEGDYMAGVFNMLRANDLIWSFYVNNYLLGKSPKAFDLLYWNSDSTRMPASMHTWYIKNFYVDDKLKEPDGVSIDGIGINLSKIDVPTCFVSTIEDHIAPWKSTYAGTWLVSGPVKFILSGSGHIAGIINPPAAKKYNYRTTDNPPSDLENWVEDARVNEGSWWPEWQNWISRKCGKKIPCRVPGDGKLDIIEDAPGSYVRTRLDNRSD